MSDPNQQLLLLLAAAQQQQSQQAALSQLMAKLQKAPASAPAAPNGSSEPSTSSVSISGAPGPSTSSSAAPQLQNVALMQQIAQLAQFGALMEAQKKAQQEKEKAERERAAKEKERIAKEKAAKAKAAKAAAAAAAAAKAAAASGAASGASGAIGASGLSPEMLVAWQQAVQLQAIQQMMLTPQKAQMEEAIKKMMEMAKKKPVASASGASGASGGAGPSTSAPSGAPGATAPGAGAPGAPGASGAGGTDANIMNNVMWQLVAQQMAQKQQQQQKESQKKAEQLKKAKELAKQQAKEQEAKTKQQEEIVKFLMAQHQLNHQKKHQQKKEEAASNAAMLVAKQANELAAKYASDGTDEGVKKSVEMLIRLPLQLGWRRQTCVRVMTATGLRGDVSYFAPCGKKMGSYADVVRYLTKNSINYLSRDNFTFTTKMIIGEFIVPKPQTTPTPSEDQKPEEPRQEKEFIVMTEDEINTELAKLFALKNPPKPVRVVTPAAQLEPEVVIPVVAAKKEEPEEPLDPSEINDDFQEDLAALATSSGPDECKIRERENDDLLIAQNDARHLPEFPRVENQCLTSQGFADALMVHEFVQNFGHVLGIDLEKTPKLEALCAGLAGDAQRADQILQLTRQLLRLALEFPGMGNEKRFGQGGGEMGLDRENFSEVMRLFLIDKGSRGVELSTPLLTANFFALRGEQKAAILAFLCDELVCSRNVVTEIDRNLEEISRLRGEKWMRDGKARALRAARSKKPAEVHIESDSEPPTRPMTPKVAPAAPNGVAVSNSPAVMRKFTPGLGQCEVLTEQEESMNLEQMDGLIGELQQEAHNINQKIHDAGLRIRSYPFGIDRFHRNYWLLPHTNAVLVESLATSSENNPACNVHESAAKDPKAYTFPDDPDMDVDVLACLENVVDEVVLSRAHADKKIRKRYRRVENHVKRGWWTIPSRESVESLRISLLGRGIRERALHRLLCKPWFINDLKFGTISLEKVGEPVDLERMTQEGWKRLGAAIEKLRSHLKMADVTVFGPENGKNKPVVVPPTMALAQIVKDDVEWKMFDFDGIEEDVKVQEKKIRQMIVETAEMVDPKFWRPKFRPISVKCEAIPPEEVVKTEEIKPLEDVKPSDDSEDVKPVLLETPSPLYEDWKQYVLHEASTTSQLMVALQAIEGMIMWERCAREALCQICKSMDGDEMLVCDGCDSGCHMECFRPRMTKVPEGDWFCQRCREEKSGKPMCMFCSKESGVLYKCQRCAYHVHQDCAQDGPKETIHPETFICGHCQEMKQMRFVKRLILRGESEERENEEEENEQKAAAAAAAAAGANGAGANGATPTNGGSAKANLKRKLEQVTNGGLPGQMTKELCALMLEELMGQTNAIPFLEPVNPKLVPGYKMVIVKPIDLGTIRNKNEKNAYETPEDFTEDVELMFANCRQFNIDHSEIGRAGMNLHKFFQKRWKQLKYNFTKRLRRLARHS